jgi:hypothetical protein
MGDKDATAYVQDICARCGCSPDVHHLLDDQHFSCVGPDRTGCKSQCPDYLGFLINQQEGYVRA